jgi:RNA-directed DNA polymerase
VQKRDNGNTKYFPLEYAGDTKIVRFPKIKTKANPYDENWQLYFEERETEKMRISLKGHYYLIKMFNEQKGCCAICKEKLTLETGGRCHKYWKNGVSFNQLVHPSCHRKAHSNLDFKEFFTPAYCGGNRL